MDDRQLSEMRLLNAVTAIRTAINDAGPRPDVHRRTMERHRREWPALWKAIDELLARGESHRKEEGNGVAE